MDNPSIPGSMTPSQVARQLGCTYWSLPRDLPCTRTPSGQRRYDAAAVEDYRRRLAAPQQATPQAKPEATPQATPADPGRVYSISLSGLSQGELRAILRAVS